MASSPKQGDPSSSICISQQWSEAAETIAYGYVVSHPPIALICGPKNSGKSTFSRHLINVLLKRYRKVGYLDTDVGQPEFTAAGLLSFTVVDTLTSDLAVPCLKTPERCLFFGDISSKRDPTTYVKYICTIYDYYQKEYMLNMGKSSGKTELPLVVNTPGWVKGVGYDILVDMLKYIAPTHVVKINISSERKNLPAGPFWLGEDDYGREVNLLEIPACQDSFNRSLPAQKDSHLLRDIRIMAYFRQCFPSNFNITTIKELANAIASHPPYQVSISTIHIRHLHCQVPRSEIFYSLNATIVGLAVTSERSEDVPWCVGLGIVRGIDKFKDLLYVITPVTPSTLQKVDLLLQGFIEIPICLLQVQGCMSPYMSTNVLATS
ncbi:hypothetical protein K2173_027331 [Erythroxylum novogranatense]|uniref:Polynucleotide 5'-hydroxyl-kinase NOL9 n=1 Tax=Erythroxylum novogranatense TaxID=1862640 RepID=A0AAV8U206_9ROSI|nr:hypothetical protein K2173_027331 [Erythroxylum novogranatense]